MPPSGERFVDVFAGRGNVAFAAMALLDYTDYWINDKRNERFFLAIHNSLDKRIPTPHMVRRLPHTSQITLDAYDIMKARGRISKQRTLLEPLLTFSGGGYEQAGRRSLKGGGVSASGFYRNFLKARKLMSFYPGTKTRITALDWRKVFAELGPDDFCFCDPPYVGANVKTYGWKIEENIAFRDALMDAKFKWMLTEYRHKIYKPLTELFGKPRTFRVQKTINNANRGWARQWVTECVWKNF
jgi:site-specific DNA-adenine methylase